MRLRHFVLVPGLVVLLCACSSAPQAMPAAFSLYSGNESLPPEYQRITTIKAEIHPTYIDLVYGFRDAAGKLECPVKVEGERFHAYAEIVRNTRLEAERAAIGGGSFEVTFTDAAGKRRSGKPSNREDWEGLIASLQAEACPAPAPG